MKTRFFQFSFFLLLLSFFVKCAAPQPVVPVAKVVLVSSTKPTIKNDSIGYISKAKLDRKTFFVDTDLQTKWVDSIFNAMTLDEKIGQLFMVAAYSSKEEARSNDIDRLIIENKIGGIIFFKGGPVRQVKLTNRFQSKSKIPLFIGNDAEWGLSMRLDSTFKYPYNMTLGAIRDLKLIQKMGSQMGSECNRMGIHFNFAPVIDVNTNPNNPIIGNRSFGENKVIVADAAIALMTGIQLQGVLATGKHFPGHGESATDSHITLPSINLSKERINLVELYPYKRLFDAGLASVMVAHLNIPSLEIRPDYPSSLSYKIVTDLLQNEMGFDGLIFTDALNMKGVSNFKKAGEIDLEAFKAGNDILLFPENVALASEKICLALQDSTLSMDRLNYSVKKILKYKYKVGLNKRSSIKSDQLVQDLNSAQANALQFELYENAITVLKNDADLLPIKNLNQKIGYIKIGEENNTSFLTTLNKYMKVTPITETNIDSLKMQLKNFDKIIIGIHKTDKAFKKHEITASDAQFIVEISKIAPVILDVFAKPYLLAALNDLSAIKSIVVSYQNADVAQEVSAELLFGAIESKGRLPVAIGNYFKVNDGLSIQKINRLGFSTPENVGMSTTILSKLEGIAKKAIDLKCAPGMQIVVARKGKVIYQKSFGSPTYENKTKITNSDIFDVASVTKIIATLPNLMQQFEKNNLTLDTELGQMLPNFKGSNKEHINLKHLLTHSAGLQSWIPFYKKTIDSLKMPLSKYYRKTASTDFLKQVADSLFISTAYADTIVRQIINSPVDDNKDYKYSDLTFMIAKQYLEQATSTTLDNLSTLNFYNVLGMNNTMYNPLGRVDKNQIVPTEIDTYFRHSLIQGTVHDMAAAMQGGVAGHAGVFSNAMDVAKMMQMYLQKGNYGGTEFFKSSTFDIFNSCYFCDSGNRRGLGFDKPELDSKGNAKHNYASKSSFGHTGFTGIMAWADPETETVFVFLSNRTYPDSTAPNKLSNERIRETMQQIIFDAIIK